MWICGICVDLNQPANNQPEDSHHTSAFDRIAGKQAAVVSPPDVSHPRQPPASAPDSYTLFGDLPGAVFIKIGTEAVVGKGGAWEGL